MDYKPLYWRMMFANVIDEIGMPEFESANIDQKYLLLREKLAGDCDSEDEYRETIKAICEYLDY